VCRGWCVHVGKGCMQVRIVHGVYKCSNVDGARVCALQVCRQRMCLCDPFFSAYIIKSSLQPIGSSYMHINIYDDSSAPSDRASGARGRKQLI